MTTTVLVAFTGKDAEVVRKVFASFKGSVDVEARVLGDYSGDDVENFSRVVRAKEAFNQSPRKVVQSSFKFGA